MAKLKLYKAIDVNDDELSLFMTDGEKVARSTFIGDSDPWIEGFETFSMLDWSWQDIDSLNDMIDPELLMERDILDEDE